ncbi:MAG: hypothetical protein QM723_20560 [Myxococcaceae bacterium]
MDEAANTPWAKVQVLRARNVPFDQIVRQLLDDGLSPDDVTLLFEGQPELERPRPPFPVTPDSMKRPEGEAAGGLFGFLKKPALKGIDDLVKPGDLYVSHEVQWKVQLPAPSQLGWGESVDTVWHVQSCTDGPRRLVIQVGGDRAALLGELSHDFELSPGRVERLVLPLRVQVLAPKRITWVLDPIVVGRGGTPLRPKRGQPWTSPPRNPIEALGRIGVTAYEYEDELTGGGSSGLDGVVEVRCDTRRPFSDRPRELERSTLYQPSADELSKARG